MQGAHNRSIVATGPTRVHPWTDSKKRLVESRPNCQAFLQQFAFPVQIKTGVTSIHRRGFRIENDWTDLNQITSMARPTSAPWSEVQYTRLHTDQAVWRSFDHSVGFSLALHRTAPRAWP